MPNTADAVRPVATMRAPAATWGCLARVGVSLAPTVAVSTGGWARLARIAAILAALSSSVVVMVLVVLVVLVVLFVVLVVVVLTLIVVIVALTCA